MKYSGCHKGVAIARGHCEGNKTIPSIAASPRPCGTPRNDYFDKPFTVINAPRLSDPLLSLPQSLYGKTNTFLHSTNGIGQLSNLIP
jgi:hypothetical protein